MKSQGNFIDKVHSANQLSNTKQIWTAGSSQEGASEEAEGPLLPPYHVTLLNTWKEGGERRNTLGEEP